MPRIRSGQKKIARTWQQTITERVRVGKSSLINARLVPQLRQANFAVLPISRVGGELPAGISQVDNIFLFNLFLSLDESDGDPNRFINTNCTDFLAGLTSMDGQHYYYDAQVNPEAAGDDVYEESPYILIIDQFEEIVTTHPERWPEREEFFRQIAQAMAKDPLLWLVLSLREDYVAALDPYTHLLPGKLRAQFYMQRMDYEAGLEAVKKPARQYNRPFAPGVAEELVDNLRQIRAGDQSPDQAKTRPGQFIEPVQLQVVCYQLWENLAGRPPGEITQQDLQELGDVDTALAQFYEQALAGAISQTGVSEIDLRNWFENQLITEAGTRGTVYRGKIKTGGIDNRIADLLAGKFLLHPEVRTGGTWYELVHDRFIDPILQANQGWRLQQPLIQLAQSWKDSGKNVNVLLEGQPLKQALEADWRGLGPLVEEFLEASQQAQKAREKALEAEKEALRETLRQRELEQAQALAEEQQKRAEEAAKAAANSRKRAIMLAGLAFIAILMAVIAGVFGFKADKSARMAEIERVKAITAQQVAETESTAAAANAAAAAANADAARDILAEQQATQTAVATSTVVAAAVLETQADDLENQARSLEATLTVQASSAEATTEASALVSSTPSVAPPLASTVVDAATPTASATSTPDKAATSTTEAIEDQLVQVRAEQAVMVDISTVQASPQEELVSCDSEAIEEFYKEWESYNEELGCPVSGRIGGFFAEQSFENGDMFWSQILDQFLVFIGDKEGQWRQIGPDELQSYNPNGAGCTPPESPPTDLYQPIRGFGSIWCDFPEISNDIGWAVKPERGVSNNILQAFENGIILRDDNSSIYVLFKEDQTYVTDK